MVLCVKSYVECGPELINRFLELPQTLSKYTINLISYRGSLHILPQAFSNSLIVPLLITPFLLLPQLEKIQTTILSLLLFSPSSPDPS